MGILHLMLSPKIQNHSTNCTLQTTPPIEPWFQYVIYTNLLLTFVFGVAANMIVCKTICNRKRRKRAIHYLVLNLAVPDMLILIIYLPLTVYQIHDFLPWGFGKMTCKISGIIYVMSVNVKIMTLIAVTTQRYFDITDPFTLHIRAGTSLKVCIVVIWLLSAGFSIPAGIISDMRQRSCSYNWAIKDLVIIQWIVLLAVQMTLPTFFFVATFSIIGYRTCNERIPKEVAALYKAMGRSKVTSMGRSQVGSKRSWTAVRKERQTKLIKLAITLVILYFLCICPQHLVQVGFIYKSSENGSHIYISTIPKILFISNSLLNPFVYSVQNREVKRMVRQLICFWTSHKEPKLSVSWSQRRMLTVTSSGASSAASEFYT